MLFECVLLEYSAEMPVLTSKYDSQNGMQLPVSEDRGYV